MNAKTAKKIRAVIRGMFAHLPVHELTTPTRVTMVPDYSAGLNPDGTLKLIPFTSTGTQVNTRYTQRYAHRHAKAQFKLARAAS